MSSPTSTRIESHPPPSHARRIPASRLLGQSHYWCHQGYYYEGDATCRECPAGTYNSKTKNYDTYCTECEAGTFSDEYGRKTACDDCPINTFQTKPGQTACIGCPPGQYQDMWGQTYCNNNQIKSMPCADTATNVGDPCWIYQDEDAVALCPQAGTIPSNLLGYAQGKISDDSICKTA